jgi:plasmid stabilization system protein ParE
MRRVVWTRTALADLDRLEAFLIAKSPRSASKAVIAIMDSTRVLVQFPHAGRMTEDLDPEHRELIIKFSDGGYVVHYGVFDDRIEILDVRHQREARS